MQGAFALLRPELRSAIAAEGYEAPTPIQQQAIPFLMDGRDLLGTAQTGTGKTAAFTLPMLERLAKTTRRAAPSTPRALVLAPTRELAAQIGESIRTYGRHLQLSHAIIFGGVSQHHQVRSLQRGVDVLVATPGRLLDLMGQGEVRLNRVEIFVLDEVDRMLDMGFVNDIRKVLADVPQERQTVFLSATMAPAVQKLAHTMVRDPVTVTIAPQEPTVERINEKVLFVGKQDKPELLTSLLRDPGVGKVIVFTQMKHMANRVAEHLAQAGVRATAIHGNKSQAARTKALGGFRHGTFKVLVATDVAARGIDVDDISHVINYDLPVEAETYVHRIGRTARAGASGSAISFCSAEERAYLREIESLLGRPVPADLDHAHHCNQAYRSNLPKPVLGRRNHAGAARQGGNGRPSRDRGRGRHSRPGRRRAGARS